MDELAVLGWLSSVAIREQSAKGRMSFQPYATHFEARFDLDGNFYTEANTVLDAIQAFNDMEVIQELPN